jgi:hypothetical protein
MVDRLAQKLGALRRDVRISLLQLVAAERE